MMLITCPHCGPRNEDEFVCFSEAAPRRPVDPAALTDEEWVDYVYFRANTKGRVRERWWHARGCRRWLLVERDTMSHAIGAVTDAREENPR
jgi:heterotetrameric sarcosine oxidase delta subunit